MHCFQVIRENIQYNCVIINHPTSFPDAYNPTGKDFIPCCSGSPLPSPPHTNIQYFGQDDDDFPSEQCFSTYLTGDNRLEQTTPCCYNKVAVSLFIVFSTKTLFRLIETLTLGDNNKGPTIEPQGTPQRTCLLSYRLLLQKQHQPENSPSNKTLSAIAMINTNTLNKYNFFKQLLWNSTKT